VLLCADDGFVFDDGFYPTSHLFFDWLRDRGLVEPEWTCLEEVPSDAWRTLFEKYFNEFYGELVDYWAVVVFLLIELPDGSLRVCWPTDVYPNPEKFVDEWWREHDTADGVPLAELPRAVAAAKKIRISSIHYHIAHRLHPVYELDSPIVRWLDAVLANPQKEYRMLLDLYRSFPIDDVAEEPVEGTEGYLIAKTPEHLPLLPKRHGVQRLRYTQVLLSEEEQVIALRL